MNNGATFFLFPQDTFATFISFIISITTENSHETMHCSPAVRLSTAEFQNASFQTVLNIIQVLFTAMIIYDTV